MATLTATTTTTKTSSPIAPGLTLDLLPYIDMTTLSQSELHSLSLCSSSSYSFSSLTSPSIDRSTFNESAGSRRQTYSRPSSLHHPHHHRHPLPKPPNPATTNTTITTTENHSIISFLKNLLSSHPLFQEPNFTNFEILTNPITFASVSPQRTESLETKIVSFEPMMGCLERKRKRGRKPKQIKVLSVEDRERVMGLEVVNKNGEIVDLVGLANLVDPYKEELKRRTDGMEKEEELLGFFKELGGQWCSRRRKRKIVDASEFGDTLPVGWKLLLGLKRKEGRAWVYCRRYISPGGKQFVSCKEVAVYLQSFCGQYDAQRGRDPSMDNIQQDQDRAALESHVVANERVEDQWHSNEHEKEIALLGIDNLAEVQIHDLFECHKCRMTFEDKHTYLQHLLSFHQRTTRKYRLGSSVGDGVIIKDGKYECQFCHKIFNERRRYNGHVGIHVRNYVRGLEEYPAARTTVRTGIDSLAQDVPARISKMDALIEIAQNSIRETTASGPKEGTSDGLTSDKQNVVSKSKIPAPVSDHKLNFDSSLIEPGREISMMGMEKSLSPELTQKKGDLTMIGAVMEKDDAASDAVDLKMDSSSADAQHGNMYGSLCRKDGSAPKIDETDHSRHLLGIDGSVYPKLDNAHKITGFEVETGFGSNNSIANNDIVQESGQPSHVLQLQQPHDFDPPNSVLDKGENELGVVNQRQDKLTGFEELRLEEIEQLKYSFGTGQESLNLHEVPLDLANDTEIVGAYDASDQFESAEIVDAASGQHLTTLCVWCGIEFNYEAVDTEIQSDSVGYMCPACKAKISGQLNVLDGGCS